MAKELVQSVAKKHKDAVMPSAEFNTLKSYLQSQGFSTGEIGAVIGAAASGRSRDLIAKILVSHLRTLPKKSQKHVLSASEGTKA